jgi:hypothetical protein
MNKSLITNTFLKLTAVCVLFLSTTHTTMGRTYTAIANGDWNGGTAVWSCMGGGCVANPNPTSGSTDDIIIPSSFTIILNVDYVVDQNGGSITVEGTLREDATSRLLTIGETSGAAGDCSFSGTSSITCDSTTETINNYTSTGSSLHITGTGKLTVSDMRIEKACAFVANGGLLRISDDLQIEVQANLVINGTVQVVGD